MHPDYARIKSIAFYCLLHLLLFLAAFFLFRVAAGEALVPSEAALKQFDVVWYHSIIEAGYRFKAEAQSNVAFFPFFPYLWKLLQLNNLGISLVNLLLFLLGFGMLAYHYRFPVRRLLLFVSVPSFMFMVVPYTEALFFFFSVLLLLALKNRHLPAACLLLFICSFIRPVATVFLPALLLMELLNSRQPGSHPFRNMLFYTASILAGLGGVMLIQYIQTGYGMGFVHAQKQWDHFLRLPELPLTSWGSLRLIHILDGTALLLGLGAGMLILKELAGFFKGKISAYGPDFLFSTLYLAGITGAILLFQGGSLQSLNRYFFCTAFFILFLNFLLDQKPLKPSRILWVFLGLTIFWLLFKSYVTLSVILKFGLASLYLIAFLGLAQPSEKLNKVTWVLIYGANILIQAKLLQLFLQGNWIG